MTNFLKIFFSILKSFRIVLLNGYATNWIHKIICIIFLILFLGTAFFLKKNKCFLIRYEILLCQNEIYKANCVQRSITFIPAFCILLPFSFINNQFFKILRFIYSSFCIYMIYISWHLLRFLPPSPLSTTFILILL